MMFCGALDRRFLAVSRMAAEHCSQSSGTPIWLHNRLRYVGVAIWASHPALRCLGVGGRVRLRDLHDGVKIRWGVDGHVA